MSNKSDEFEERMEELEIGNFIVTDDEVLQAYWDNYGRRTASVVMTKEVFIECYNRWINDKERIHDTD